LLHAEQGYGDTIQFIRNVQLVAEKGARIILKCMKELKLLLQSVEGVNEIIRDSEHLPEFHMQCPIMRLPLIFNTIPGTIPSAVPYVKANAELTLK
jgi:hypothetical protein